MMSITLKDYVQKKNINKSPIRTHFVEPINKCANITAKIISAVYKSKLIMFKLDKDTPKIRVYFLSFMNSLKILLSNF